MNSDAINIIDQLSREKGIEKDVLIEALKAAVETALKRMDNDSILLVLGKGRENYQEIGTGRNPYSDVIIIEEF